MAPLTSSLFRYGSAFAGGALLGGVVGANGAGEVAKQAWAAIAGKSESDQTDQARSSPGGRSAFDPHILKYGPPQALIGPLERICYTNHCLEFDPRRRTPLWVAEHISGEKIKPEKPSAHRKRSKFRPDDALPLNIQASNEDYWNSGWSRGHMAPAGNNKHCQQSMDDTFMLTNIVPQSINNNSDFWNRLEMYCRDLTDKYADVRVISGPLWIPEVKPEVGGGGNDDDDDDRPDAGAEAEWDAGKRMKYKRKRPKVMKYEIIGANEVSVPTHLYKVVLAEGRRPSAVEGGGGGGGGDRPSSTLPGEGQPSTLMAAFIVPNKPIPKEKGLKDFWVPLPTLEERVGFRFHHRLDREQVKDLCEVEGCQMLGWKKFQKMSLKWAIRGARKEQDMAKVLEHAKKHDILDDQLVEKVERKIKEIRSREEEDKKRPKEKPTEETPPVAAAA